MKRHYTTTDIAVLQALAGPGWWELQEAEDMSLMSIHASLIRLATDNLVELRFTDDDELSARRLSLPAEVSRILAA